MAWLSVIGRNQWLSLSKQAVVCSIHFTEECFDRTSACGIVRLREEFLPSLFITPVNYDPNICTPAFMSGVQEYPTQMLSDVEMSDISEKQFVEERLVSLPSTSTSLASSKSTQTSETFYTDLSSRQTLTTELAKMSSCCKSARRELRNLKRKNQRKTKKLANMKNIITHLSKSKLLEIDSVSPRSRSCHFLSRFSRVFIFETRNVLLLVLTDSR